MIPRATNSGDLRGHIIAVLLLAATVFGAYSACLTGMVAHRDDYWLLWEPVPVLEIWNAAGRWASGLFFRATWHGADSVGDLWRPRLASLVGIYLLVVGIYASLRRLECSWLLAVAVASLAALLPTFNVFAVWATCAAFAYSCLMAMIAFWLAEGSGRRDKVWQSAVLGLASAGALFVAFSIYQPAAMFYVTMLVMAVAAQGGGSWSRRQVLRWAIHAVVLAAAMGASFLTFKMMVHKVRNADVAARAELTSNPVTKAGRFVLQPVGQSCVPYFFVNHWSHWQIFLVELGVLGLFVPIGVWLRLEGSPVSRVVRIAALLALIPVSYVPNLVIASDYFPLRTRAAIAVLILFLLVLATSGYLRRLVTDRPRRQRVAGVGLACAIGIALALTRYHLHHYFLVPSRIEWDVVCADVEKAARQAPPGPRRVVFLMPDADKPVLYDEFGASSAGCYWATKGMTGLAVREVAPERLPAFRNAAFINVPLDQSPPPLQPGDWEINARRLSGSAPAGSVDRRRRGSTTPAAEDAEGRASAQLGGRLIWAPAGHAPTLSRHVASSHAACHYSYSASQVLGPCAKYQEIQDEAPPGDFDSTHRSCSGCNSRWGRIPPCRCRNGASAILAEHR